MNSDIFELGAQGFSDEQMMTLVVWVFAVAMLLALAMMVVFYVFQSIGLHTLAKRRGIKHPWLAWIPFGDYWIIGSISDNARLWNNNELNYRRILLVALMGGTTLLSLVQSWPAFKMLWLLQSMDEMNMDAIILEMEQYILQLESYETGFGALLSMAVNVASIVGMVLYYMSLYDLYASCRPQQKVMFLVLSIVINVTLPFFIFACRKYDDGMAPQENQALPQPPSQEPQWPSQEPPQEPEQIDL